ncbi:tyrosine-type recombinase/integrase [Pseudonocardia sp. DSM 110487]|uniref:tyrosine-type recombinase/integrase n=1 Tax=Pseudonocardia sp. DSM 110487 TaxID=2865833 RepID=UPI00351D114B
MAGPGLGHARLADHGHRRPPGGAVWPALVARGSARRSSPRSAARSRSTGRSGSRRTPRPTSNAGCALDPETVTALTEHNERCTARCEALDVPLARDAFVFSLAPDSSRPLVPSSVSQRYSRLAKRLDIDTHLHCLRHYSATELIAAGVDVRTVAGRLGHGGGGVTTLRVYAAWVAEADQRAAAVLAQRGPARPAVPTDDVGRVLRRPRSPRERLAVELRERIIRRVRRGRPPPRCQGIGSRAWAFAIDGEEGVRPDARVGFDFGRRG